MWSCVDIGGLSTIYRPVLSHPRYRLGLFFALIGAIAFSGKAIVVKLLLREGIDPIAVLGLRMALAAPVFVCMAVWGARKNAEVIRPHLGRIFVLAKGLIHSSVGNGRGACRRRATKRVLCHLGCSWCRTMLLPSLSSMIDMRQTGEGMMSDLNFTSLTLS